MEFKTFEDLEVYKAARELRKKIYKLIKKLPEEEKLINRLKPLPLVVVQ